MEFAEKVAIVTGAARGIGATTAWAFAERGATSIIVDINGEGAEKVAADIQAKGLKAMAFTVDVSKKLEVDVMVEELFNKFGRIDILVNNAFVSGG
jgi:3-oxoacyl-[acyl-carrier protein] reductase